MSDKWDSDIASLLDDVLQDSAPEKDEALSSDTPDANGDLPPILVEAGTPGYFDSDCDDCGKRGECEHRGSPPGAEVTTVVTPVVPEFSVETDEDVLEMPQFTTDELMESIDVRNFGTLVSLTNSRWHAKKRDKDAALNAAKAVGAVDDSFESRKKLLVGVDEKLKRVHSCIDAARTDHYRLTLPWSTIGVNDHGKRAGPRFLPNTMLFEYSEVQGRHKAEMIEALDEFVDAYPSLVALVQQKLGTAFNQSDYPPTSAIRQYFTLEFDFEPIPQGADFQGLQDSQARKLAAALNKKTRKRLENALQDAWKRTYDTIERAVSSLTNPDSVFHYTLTDALKETVDQLTHLNVTNDERIDDVRAAIVSSGLTKWDAKDIRKDDALRKRLGEAAVAIRDKMKECVNG